MEQLLNLKELGDRLHRIDMLVVALLRRRIELALQVGEFKIKNGQKMLWMILKKKTGITSKKILSDYLKTI